MADKKKGGVNNEYVKVVVPVKNGKGSYIFKKKMLKTSEVFEEVSKIVSKGVSSK